MKTVPMLQSSLTLERIQMDDKSQMLVGSLSSVKRSILIYLHNFNICVFVLISTSMLHKYYFMKHRIQSNRAMARYALTNPWPAFLHNLAKHPSSVAFSLTNPLYLSSHYIRTPDNYLFTPLPPCSPAK